MSDLLARMPPNIEHIKARSGARKGGSHIHTATTLVSDADPKPAYKVGTTIQVPYTLYYTLRGQRGFLPAQTLHAKTAADALHQYRSLTASDHFVTFIKGPKGRRVALEE